jgi:hypothetical protein
MDTHAVTRPERDSDLVAGEVIRIEPGGPPHPPYGRSGVPARENRFGK